ncbi:MAG: hypothetical protein M3Y87_23360 [Myxococcota bacterium]|nr:hypothetical protein [Myxococcota bacterium]
MRISIAMTLTIAALAVACGAAREEEPTSASEAGGEEPVAAAADPAEAPETSDAPRAPVFGNDAVRARLAALPPAPLPLDTRILDLTPTQVVSLCTFLDAQSAAAPVVSTRCPDGSPVVVGGTCNPANLASAVETLGASCEARLGEYVACELAVREDPCSIGFLRAERPECEAVNACLLAAASAMDADVD